ncbi:hypothetical protein [Candidatus Nitrotoga sp. BS]|uniref:hypothetical protein n=1 Tax=Candidatus Nitrotoga sp. BS TaxID=2890408 RepID=UPI001EF28D61|nr:hypothetical protein [Candidatus Nitrotoga sp. BS]
MVSIHTGHRSLKVGWILRHWEVSLSEGVNDGSAAKSFGYAQAYLAIKRSVDRSLCQFLLKGCDFGCFSQEEQDMVAWN